MLENEIPRKSAPAYSVKGKTRSHLEDVAVLGDGVKEIGHCSDPSRTNPAQGSNSRNFAPSRQCRPAVDAASCRGCPVFDAVSAQEKRLTRRVQMAGCRLAYFARRVALFASYSRTLFGQNEIVAGARETRRSWAKIAECHKGKRK